MDGDSPTDYARGRLELQRVATHVLARARFASDGRFGLRVTGTGIGTPAFGPHRDVLRIVGAALVREHQDDGPARSTTTPIAGRSLGELAAFAGVDLDAAFSAGGDSPAAGDPGAPIALDGEVAAAVMSWLRLGAEALDRTLPGAVEPSVVQLWPEHFDVGVDVATTSGRVTLGASPGDAAHPEPYVYLGPWDEARPGDPGFWNAPFGALLGRGAVVGASDPVGAAAAFLAWGLELLD
jgi:hypothetical protein